MRALFALILISCGAPGPAGIVFCDGGALVCVARTANGCTHWSCDVGEVRAP